MWDCNPVLTPMDPNVRLTKRDSPEVVDPRLHRRMRSIVGGLSYLLNMTRPDLAFTYSQLSKFVQSPCPVHLAAAEFLHISEGRKMETPRLAMRMSAVLEDEACHEEFQHWDWKERSIKTHTRVPYKVYNSVPVVLYLKPFRTTGCTT